jgi:uncharacterized protein YbjT (DUF2867 family)
MGLVTVFGGTGFLGRRIVERLTRGGATVRVAVRHPEWVKGDRDPDRAGATTAMWADVRDPLSVAAAITGAESVVNAVSAYIEKGATTYAAVHEHGAANVARECQREGVARLVHISGIGADPAARSTYIRARGRGERVVRDAFSAAVILRPSVMFGWDDAFVNALARIVRSTPVIPLIGGGRTPMQPIHVLDVAEAVSKCLDDPASSGRIYELGGPETQSLRGIIEMIAARLGLRRSFVPVPFALAHPMARLLELLPKAPLTAAQVDLLREPSVPSPLLPGIDDLAINPRRLADTISELPPFR